MGIIDNIRPANRRLIYFTAITLLAGVVAFVIGYYSRRTSSKCIKTSPDDEMSELQRAEVHKNIVDLMNTDHLKANLRYFAGKPHVASSTRTNEISKEIHKRFESYDFQADYYEYNTLLSFPHPNKPNRFYIVDGAGKEVFKSQQIENIIEPNEKDPNLLPPFLAYGPSGTAKGELIYANYGRKKDYEELIEKYGINITGKIVLVKYGQNGRGAKVEIAASFKAIGILIYGDPVNYAPALDKKFPNGRWLSDDGVQRGSIIGYGEDVTEGDLLTKGYPAKDWAYYLNATKFKGLPKIPAQPISSHDALRLMEEMGGVVMPTEWQGTMNVTYRSGPFKNPKYKVKLTVFNELKEKKIRNVCGTIYGKHESDRYILLGNHIDSWVFGAVDASSGTTVMMEIARALGIKVKTGWKPRRTIKLCGWDGEEYNLIGSTEFVEEFSSQLKERAVAYINVDSAVAGNYSLKTAASPLLHEMMFKVHKLVSDPYANQNVFEKAHSVYKDKNYPKDHSIGSLGAGSDYYAFYQFLGIPSIDVSYRQGDLDKKYNTSYYPQYHTLHDTIFWMENFVDKEYKIHLTVAKVSMYYLLYLADTPIVPLNGQRYAVGLKRAIIKLEKELQKKGMPVSVQSYIDQLKQSADRFISAVTSLTKQQNAVDTNNVLKLRMVNDRLTQLEKGFTYSAGIPGNSQIKHYIMAPSSGSVDSSFPLPAIANLLPNLNKTQNWDEVKKQVTITTYLIQAVSESIKAPPS